MQNTSSNAANSVLSQTKDKSSVAELRNSTQSTLPTCFEAQKVDAQVNTISWIQSHHRMKILAHVWPKKKKSVSQSFSPGFIKP